LPADQAGDGLYYNIIAWRKERKNFITLIMKLKEHRADAMATLDNCPSCNGYMARNYCPECGEKRLTREDLSAKTLLNELVEEITSFDSRFYKTIRYLMTRPGFLTEEFCAGRRTLYLKPLRLYLTIVVIHFLLFELIPTPSLISLSGVLQFDPTGKVIEFYNQAMTGSNLPASEFDHSVKSSFSNYISFFAYAAVFVMATILHFLFPKSNRVYGEHLVFSIHLIAFGMIRNILIMPLLMIGFAVALPIAFASQLIYVILGFKNFYHEHTWKNVLFCFILMAGFALFFFISIIIAFFLSIYTNS
jgi:hypothetical protein